MSRARNLALVLATLSVVGAVYAWRNGANFQPKTAVVKPQVIATKGPARESETEDDQLKRAQSAKRNAKLEAFLKERGRTVPNLFAACMLGEVQADIWAELSERQNDPLAMMLLMRHPEEVSFNPFGSPNYPALAGAKRFQELESDNAYADLILLQLRRGDEMLTGKEIVDLLVSAARKKRFDSHAQEFEIATLNAESACQERLRDAWLERMRTAPGPGSFILEMLGDFSLPNTWSHMITRSLEEKESPTFVANPDDRRAMIRSILALIELAERGPSELHGQSYAQEMRATLTYGLTEEEHMKTFGISIDEAKERYRQEQNEDLKGLFQAAIHLASEKQIDEMNEIYHSQGLAKARKMLIDQMDRHTLEERAHLGGL